MPNLFKREPVLVTSVVTAVVGFVATFLVGHGIITDTVASTTVQEVAPTVVLIVLSLVGVFIREFVSPVAMRAERAVEKAVPAVAPYVPGFNQRVADEYGRWSVTYPATANTTSVVPTMPSASVYPPYEGVGAPFVSVPTPVVPPAHSDVSDSSASAVPQAMPMSAGAQ